MRARVLASVLLLLAAGQAVALEPAEQRRYQNLVEQLRCAVCQNQSIAESNADLAQDLREQVRMQIEAGRSDQEILDYMAARYGDFVLYKPPLKAKTLLLWTGPFILLLAALVFVWRLTRRQSAPPSEPDADKLRRLLENREP